MAGRSILAEGHNHKVQYISLHDIKSLEIWNYFDESDIDRFGGEGIGGRERRLASVLPGIPARSLVRCKKILGGLSAMKSKSFEQDVNASLSRRTILQAGAAAFGGALMPGMMGPAFAEDHPAIGTYPAGVSGSWE